MSTAGSEWQCARCGAAQRPGASYCWQCGASLGGPRQGPGIAHVLGAVVLLLLALPLGLVGMCASMITQPVLLGHMEGAAYAAISLPFLVIGLGGAVLCILGAVKMLK